MQTHTILVVDDDPHIREVICFALQKASYGFEVAADGKEALDKATLCDPALIVLDIGLPEMDGLEVCKHLRKTSDVPVLFLSARDDEIDRIVGLEIGADDYVTKPFSPRELIARIGAILKRYGAPAPVPEAGGEARLQNGILELVREQRLVQVSDEPVALTAIEFDILAALLSRPKIVFTREQILERAYKDNIHVSDRTIDSHIRNIRAKLGAAGCVDAIETVHGVGFRLGPCHNSHTV
ncbi:MAG: response regulator transcription factor [Roseibium sp.]|uniref:response regulator transcription factor n=1 Tax=Roseibium sp. TaxID=1936156 RepID=UPI0026290F47|nr:response regulator transcription factor [Roseibium sp.]MCV0424086.1 response regulator transcription factor [Roseibium sp.]